jgi:hypothetical protein
VHKLTPAFLVHLPFVAVAQLKAYRSEYEKLKEGAYALAMIR